MGIAVKVSLLLGEDDEERTIDLPAGATVRGVLGHLGIPDSQPVIVLRNGSYAPPEDELACGDALVLLPPLDGG